MTLHLWIIYLGVVAIATATPGPAVLFIVTNSMLYGWKKAIFAALGNITGLLCLGIISISGLGTILNTSQLVFDIIKYLGVAYLICMGMKMLLQQENNFDTLKDKVIITDISSRKLYFKAVGVALSNPKAIVFLTALFPQFINTNQYLMPQFTSLIAVLILFSFSCLMTYAILASQVKNWLTKSGRIKILNRISGTMFIGFGVLLATSSRK